MKDNDYSEPAGYRHEIVEVDVAVLGHTNYSNRRGAWNMHRDFRDDVPDRALQGFRQSDVRGTTFYFEGLVYAAGTIPEPPEDDYNAVVWRFDQAPMGSFFSRGWVIINNRTDAPDGPRPDPHLISFADYYLGATVSAQDLTPTDMLTTTGMENGVPPHDIVVRAVAGGTGRFATAKGSVSQRRIGRNSTGLRGLALPSGVSPPSPNFRLRFELWHLA